MRTEYRVRVGVRERWTDAESEAEALALADALDKYYRGLHKPYVVAEVQQRMVSTWREVPRGKGKR